MQIRIRREARHAPPVVLLIDTFVMKKVTHDRPPSLQEFLEPDASSVASASEPDVSCPRSAGLMSIDRR